MCDLEQPRCQRTAVVKRLKFSIGQEERVLNDVLAIHYRSGHAGAVPVKAGAQMSNRFEEREVACFEGARNVKGSRTIHINQYAARNDRDTNETDFRVRSQLGSGPENLTSNERTKNTSHVHSYTNPAP